MVRVGIVSLLLPFLLVACASELGQAPAPVMLPMRIDIAQEKTSATPELGDLEECARKTSVFGALNCLSKDKTSQ